ncbi:ATP-binding protein [Nocardioides sp.]|uniref:ATP-binding protein n=1 Tax=Nocardioides sp. TaxID=35761 RepID=UPI00260170FE|nr:ATP-binding protein [Nocardioides sp.]
MPFSRPPLVVGPGAHAAPDARRWVHARLHEIGRDELIETAELAISELVANAFLHGTAPISLCLRGTADAPRIEVHDTSPTPPRLPDGEATSVWATEGRGLSIVSRASRAWGVLLEDGGKTMWFEPAPDLSEDGVDAVIGDRRTSSR